MSDEAEANQSPTPDDAPPMAPHLDDCIISEILYRLPTKEAYRLTALCRRWRAIVSEPAFLCRHLSPRPLPLLDDGPYAFILQPRRKVGYTHLTIVPTNPDDSVDLNLPLDRKYTDTPSVKPQIRKWPEMSSKRHEPPAPSVVEIDGEEFFNNLFSTGVGDLDAAAAEEPGQLPGDGGAASPDSAAVEVEDYVAFLERTVPVLDISIVAAHGRLLLCRSRSRYYVCDPAANRWIVLPPSSVPPTRDAARGLHYVLDAATGRVAFTVVLLVRIPDRRVLVDTFSSTTGRWDTKVIGAQGVARCLGGVASPGMHAGSSFYWLSQRRGRVVRYDVAGGRASVMREPPEAEGSNARVGRSLGSAGGRLRLCAFDIRDEESDNMMPHDGIVGTHGVWVMDAAAAVAWRRVHEAVVDDISVYYFLRLFNNEVPVDFAGAAGGSIVIDKNKFLLRYDLESGDKVRLASLYRDNGRLGSLYRRFHAFPFFRFA